MAEVDRTIPDEWTPRAARELAATLTTCGHPLMAAAIDATALDIYNLCEGVLGPNGLMVTPREQAIALVQAVRDWEAGWPERGGTHRLREQFRSMFKREELDPAYQPGADLGPKPLIACALCTDRGTVRNNGKWEYCACAAGAATQADCGDSWLALLNAPKYSAARKVLPEDSKPFRLLEAEFQETQRKLQTLFGAAQEDTDRFPKLKRSKHRGRSAR